MSDALRRIDVRRMPPVPEDEQIELDDGVISQTFLNYHDTCHRSAYLYRRWSGGAPAHALNRGTLFHLFAEAAIRHLIAEGERQLPPEMGKDLMLDILRDNPSLAVPARERDTLRQLAWNWCEGTIFEPSNIIGIEESMTLQVGNWTIRGRIDLVEQPLYYCDVTDWKTSWAQDTSVEFTPSGDVATEIDGRIKWGGNFQTQLYALMMAFGVNADGLPLAHDLDRFRMKLKYPRWLRPEGLATKECVVHRSQLLDFKLDLEAQLAVIEASLESREWQATPGSHCSECPARYACPLPRHLRPNSQLTVDAPIEEAIELAQWHYFAAQDARDVMKRLKAWAKVNGQPIPVGEDIEYAFIDSYTEQIKDKNRLWLAVEGAVNYGEPFNRDQHVSQRSSTNFKQRKINPNDPSRGE